MFPRSTSGLSKTNCSFVALCFSKPGENAVVDFNGVSSKTGKYFVLFPLMKVVIPRTGMGWKKTVFLSPQSQYEVSNHNIWGKKTSDDPFQVSNVKCYEWSTCGQQELTKVTEIGKKHTFKNTHFSVKSAQISVIFKFKYFHNEISHEVIRHGIWKLKHPS